MSNSIFSLIGSIRFISQFISYEVGFILIIYCMMILRERYIEWVCCLFDKLIYGI